MKSLGERLVSKINEISEVESVLIQLSSAIYLKTVDDKISEGINSIKENFISASKAYGISESVYMEKLNSIINEFNLEIEKIREEYEIQYVNLQLELQETMANQQIAIVNAKKMVDLKKEFMQSEKYIEYVKVRDNLKNNLENALKKEEYDKYSKLLADLSDPLELYNIKRESSIEKYYEFNSLIKECESKMEKSLELLVAEIDKIIDSVVEKSLTVKKESVFSKIFSKIINIFSGKSNFEKKVKVYESAITSLKEESTTKLESIREKTIDFLAEIKVMKEDLNKKSA